MNIFKKINQSRNTLKLYLEDEWHVDAIQDYSEAEIDILYNSNNSVIQFGNASGCNFTLHHKKYDWHKLHVVYYNFPELGKPPIKITKDCAKKIGNLYDTTIEPEDSIIVIIPENITENLEKAINELYKSGQEFLAPYSKDKIYLQNVNLAHIRNVHIFRLEHLTKDLRTHVNVPKHICIRDKNEIDEVLTNINSNISQLPIITIKDIQAKILRLAPGDLCKIIRITETGGELTYYRVCK
jgi:DNA-directed RNA polymerase subunit H (RpoH/RPB5)